MNRFSMLAIAALALITTACDHTGEPAGYVYAQPKVITTSASTTSVQNQCTADDGVQLSEAECAAQARELHAQTKAAVAAPGTTTVKTGKHCTTVNGATTCTVY